jgi:hypothetical protein
MDHTATRKYLALDVHQATSTFTFRAAAGRVLERGVVETSAHQLVALLRRLGPNLHLIFEEGTQAQRDGEPSVAFATAAPRHTSDSTRRIDRKRLEMEAAA